MRIFIILFVLILNIASFSDVLFLNNGEEITGTVIDITENDISVKVNGKTETYNRAEVLRAEFPKYREIKGEYNVSDIKDGKIRNIIKNAPSVSEYPDSNYVTLLKYKEIRIDETYVQTVTERNIELVCKEMAKSRATIPSYYFASQNSEYDILFGRTVNKGVISYVDDFSIKSSSVYSFYPEYDDLRQIIVSLPKTEVGSVIDYSFRYVTEKDTVIQNGIHDIFFTSLEEPCIENTVIIDFPEKMEKQFSYDKYIDNDISVSKEKKDGRIIYTLTRKDITPLIPEENMPPYWTYGGQLRWNIENISFEDQIAGLSEIFRRSEKDRTLVKKKLSELIRDDYSEYEKLKSIFLFITREIGDLGIPMYYSRYYPQDINRTLKNKRGNRLDRLNLFRVMLDQAGIRSEILYMASKDYFHNEKYPKVEKFSFPVLFTEVENRKYYLTADSNLSALCDIMAGKYYYVSVMSGKYDTIDFDNAERVNSVSEYNGELSRNGDLLLEINIDFFNGAGKKYRDYRYSKKEEIQNDMMEFVKYYHSSAELIDYDFRNLDSAEQDVSLSVKCRIKEYAQRTGDNILLFRLPFYFSMNSLGQEERKFDYSIDSVIASNRSIFNISVPKEFNIYSAPSIRNFSVRDYMTINSSVSVRDNMFTLEYVFTNRKDLLSREHYPEYKKAFENLSRWSEEYIVLEKK